MFATKNPGKIKEFQELFEPLGFRTYSARDFDETPDVVEDGETFKDNALKKAKAFARDLNMPALADDSGLCVDALQGKPGVYSARYAGANASDEENVQKLLKAMDTTPEENRTARFYCVLALMGPQREPIVAQGTCEGRIMTEPRGKNGFGYDPVFYVPSLQKTLAEADASQKNRISHRAEALRNLKHVLHSMNANDERSEFR